MNYNGYGNGGWMWMFGGLMMLGVFALIGLAIWAIVTARHRARGSRALGGSRTRAPPGAIGVPVELLTAAVAAPRFHRRRRSSSGPPLATRDQRRTSGSGASPSTSTLTARDPPHTFATTITNATAPAPKQHPPARRSTSLHRHLRCAEFRSRRRCRPPGYRTS